MKKTILIAVVLVLLMPLAGCGFVIAGRIGNAYFETPNLKYESKTKAAVKARIPNAPIELEAEID